MKVRATPSRKNGASTSDALAEQARGIFENAQFGVFQTSREGAFINTNDALAKILGYRSREDLVDSISDIARQIHVDPERRAEFLRRLETDGAVQGFEAQVRRKDGKKIWISISARLLADGAGPAHYEGIIEDITDRKDVEEALRSTEEKFSKAFQASPAAKSIVRASDRRFIDVNDRFLALLGYTKNEIIGRTVEELDLWFDQSDREILQKSIEQFGRLRDVEMSLRARDGTERRVLGSAEIIHVDGEPCVLSLAYDITERKRMDEMLRASEHRYRELVEGLGVAVYTTDSEGRITLYNESAVQLWGRRPDLGKDLWCGSWRLYHADGTPMAHDESPMAIAVKEDRPVRDVEVVTERPDGSRRAFIPYPTPLHDASGALVGAVNVLADITERRAAELALQDSENRLRLAMDAGGMGAWEWNIATGEVTWSETLETIHGLAPGSFGGAFQDFLADIHPEDRERAVETIQQSMSEDAYEIEYRIVRPDGRIRWLGARGQPVYNSSGKRERMIGVCMDITARKEQEEALREALEAKDEFLGLMSHELRTPITAIYGGARMLRSRADRLDDDSKREILQDIEGESERLFGMVENLLTLSRLELGATAATEPVLLQRAIDKVVRVYQGRRPNCDISIEIESGLAPVAAQPAWVELVVRNLISNADKYSPDGSPIEIRARRAGGEVEVLVLDRGPGVAPGESDKIFQAFYRSEKAARRAGGIGMGLTVCKRLTEAQNGRIWASPREGGGLEIGFTLPTMEEE